MKPRLEPRRAQPAVQSFVAFQRVAAAFPFEWHYHAEMELTFIEAGTGTRIVGDTVEPYGPGNLVLLGSNVPHTWASQKPARKRGAHRAVVVQFTADRFAGIAGPEFMAIRDLLERCGRGLRFPTNPVPASEWTKLHTEAGLDNWCRLVRVLDRLARAQDAVPIVSKAYISTPANGAQRRHERALALIASRVTEGPVYLHEIARAVHLTPAAFSRAFQRLAGQTFVAHVNELRVTRAARLLAETDQPVADIAFTCGFGNLANFNRRFRARYRQTPTSYRSAYRVT